MFNKLIDYCFGAKVKPTPIFPTKWEETAILSGDTYWDPHVRQYYRKGGGGGSSTNVLLLPEGVRYVPCREDPNTFQERMDGFLDYTRKVFSTCSWCKGTRGFTKHNTCLTCGAPNEKD